MDEKIKKLVTNYIDILSKNPDLPIFVLNEIRKKDSGFIKAIPFAKDKPITKISFFHQVHELKNGINPMHLLLNLLGMSIFPFLASPILKQTGMVEEKAFVQLMKEREALIPEWMSVLLNHHNKKLLPPKKQSKP